MRQLPILLTLNGRQVTWAAGHNSSFRVGWFLSGKSEWPPKLPASKPFPTVCSRSNHAADSGNQSSATGSRIASHATGAAVAVLYLVCNQFQLYRDHVDQPSPAVQPHPSQQSRADDLQHALAAGRDLCAISNVGAGGVSGQTRSAPGRDVLQRHLFFHRCFLQSTMETCQVSCGSAAGKRVDSGAEEVIDRRYGIGLTSYALCAVLALWNVTASLIVNVALALFFALPF